MIYDLAGLLFPDTLALQVNREWRRIKRDNVKLRRLKMDHKT